MLRCVLAALAALPDALPAPHAYADNRELADVFVDGHILEANILLETVNRRPRLLDS